MKQKSESTGKLIQTEKESKGQITSEKEGSLKKIDESLVKKSSEIKKSSDDLNTQIVKKESKLSDPKEAQSDQPGKSKEPSILNTIHKSKETTEK